MVIGKPAKPRARAFKNLSLNTLPVYYRNQTKSWMDSELFKEWFDIQFVPAVKKYSNIKGLPPKALLLIDNAPSHSWESELICGDIKAAFLPPNVTALVQPMDQGVLQNLKCHYRKKLLRALI
jgi:hypothetical protein